MQDNYITFVEIVKSLYDLLEQKKISDSEFTILMILLKKTILFKKRSDAISISQWMDESGMSKAKVVKILKSIEEKKLIKVQRRKSKIGMDITSVYSIALNNKKLLQGVSKLNTQNLGVSGVSKLNTGVSKLNTQLIDRTYDEEYARAYVMENFDEFISYLIGENEKRDPKFRVENLQAYKRNIKAKIESEDFLTVDNCKKFMQLKKGKYE